MKFSCSTGTMSKVTFTRQTWVTTHNSFGLQLQTSVVDLHSGAMQTVRFSFLKTYNYLVYNQHL